ncbi:hypothetical protein JCM5350_003694 [Sporobolomyces pararoseus]
MVKNAVTYDSIESTSTTPARVSGSSRNSSSSTSQNPRNQADSRSSNVVAPSPSAPTPSHKAASDEQWRNAAVDFQTKNPISAKSTWERKDALPPRNPIRCWNCGRVGTHVSHACPNQRVDPKRVVISSVKISSPSLPSSPSPLSQSNSIVEVYDSDDSGKDSDEEN